MKRYQHAKSVFVIGIVLVMILGLFFIFRITGDRGDEYIQSPTVYTPAVTHSSDILELQDTDLYWDRTTLICTSHIHSRDPYTSVSGAEVKITWEADGMEMEDWIDIPPMPYGTADWAVSALIHDMTPEEAESLKFTLDVSYEFEQPLSDYEYLASQTDRDDPEQLLRIWTQEYYDRETVTLTGYDLDQVTYEVRLKESEPEWLYGHVLIQLMDGDKCVYAQDDRYDSGDLELSVMEKTWRIPCDLPEWDSVTVTRLI